MNTLPYRPGQTTPSSSTDQITTILDSIKKTDPNLVADSSREYTHFYTNYGGYGSPTERNDDRPPRPVPIVIGQGVGEVCICIDFLRGKCDRSHCKFMHLGFGSMNVRMRESIVGVCPHFLEGRCMSRTCHLAHPRRFERREPPREIPFREERDLPYRPVAPWAYERSRPEYSREKRRREEDYYERKRRDTRDFR